jgi:hypothetical protein
MHAASRVGRTAVVALLALGLAGCSTAAGEGGSAAPVEAASGASGAVDHVSPASGSLRGGTKVTVTGDGLAAVRSVRVGATTVKATSHTDSSVRFAVPASARYASGKAKVTLMAGANRVATATYRYKAVNGVDRELQYVLRYWKHYNPAFQVVDDNDCVDFTSQALLQRGWKQQGAWTHDADNVFHSGAAWVSSTAFRDFMTAHPELGTVLTDDQRDRVKVGDVAQFDWDGSGDRDHTGVVTKVVKQHGTTEIFFAGHTMDSDFRSVDDAITKDHPGGVAYYWSLRS